MVVFMLLFWCVCMIAVRMDRTGSGYYRFLITNLFLACMPLLLSKGLRIARRWRMHWSVQLAVLSLWLLFLPSAPFIVTDILHLTRASEAAAWYDLTPAFMCRDRSAAGMPFTY
jgi:uncharacterized membrane protein